MSIYFWFNLKTAAFQPERSFLYDIPFRLFYQIIKKNKLISAAVLWVARELASFSAKGKNVCGKIER